MAWEDDTNVILRSPYMLANVSIINLLRLFNRYGTHGVIAILAHHERTKRGDA